MEMLALLFLYLLTQNPDFSHKVQSLCKELKNSEELLRFLKDLSCFSDLFSKQKRKEPPKTPPEPPKQDEKSPSKSPTSGIADGFIENFLNEYLKTNS